MRLDGNVAVDAVAQETVHGNVVQCVSEADRLAGGTLVNIGDHRTCRPQGIRKRTLGFTAEDFRIVRG
jgi:hypothetical protein